ncbi:MAG: acetyl-CoA hydrolase/transferase C-terminal domain-containing protein [Bacteroidia bacterium]|nr:4-hydroxybutyrate CoA-transferase [Bacteroidia bacterium]MDW8157894.1 acetyl-CoA hydrolase/transferase C-terminal domain-containing protein [Bacteroidia bacterium]
MVKYVSAEEAVSCIKSGDRVFIQGQAATPTRLIEAMTARAAELRDVELVHLHLEGDLPFTKPEYADSFKVNAFFIGSNTRDMIADGRGNYIPIFLSEIPALFRRKIFPLDVAMVHVSPIDRHGYCTLGTSVDVTLAAVQSARHVIAQVNPNMPRAHGDGIIHHSAFDALVKVDAPLPERQFGEVSSVSQTIGNYIAELVEDGATLQMGIGQIPDAVLKQLGNHKRLGIHTEMFSDGIIPLVEKGVITGEEKKWEPNKIIAGFVLGTKKVYDFIHDNPIVELQDIESVNDTDIIRKNDKVTAINSAIEVDITGQVVSDSIGSFMFSGVGGQMDFIRGASLSKGGKPIIALPSTTSKGESRIVAYLRPGAGVVTTRAHVHYVVTEFGVAYLYGKNLRQRVKAMINIAHPNHRAQLEEEAYKRFKVLV